METATVDLVAPAQIPSSLWETTIRHIETVSDDLYWFVADTRWHVLAASASFQQRIVRGRGDVRFVDTLLPSHAKDVERRCREGILPQRSAELLHPQDGGVLAVNYRFYATPEGGWFAIGRDQTHQLELVSQMSVLIDDMEREMHQQRALAERLDLLLSNDELTGLPNRRRLRDRLNAMWSALVTSDRNFALISIDIDHFKRINDQLGHAIGDDVLRAVSAAIVASVRTNDMVARFGGEEFVVLVDGADLATAETVAERIRERVESSPMPLDVGQVTISLGVAATRPERPKDPTELMSLSDQALYEAKRAGRNRIRVIGR